MKTYSIIIVCLTLGIFYGLAVKLEHQKQSAQFSNEIRSASANEVKTLNMTVTYSQCTRSKFHQNISGQNDGVYFDHHDDFSTQVTGKENRYLHTGISFIESNSVTSEMNEVAMTTSNSQRIQ